jgi:pSer/pThr/pTyr-binding forkhead associated (FHA) protein
VITCPKCSKDNQDHYKFCLGCGAELPRDAQPKPFAPNTPPHGMKSAQAVAPPPPAPQAPPQMPPMGAGMQGGIVGMPGVVPPGQMAPPMAATQAAPAPPPYRAPMGTGGAGQMGGILGGNAGGITAQPAPVIASSGAAASPGAGTVVCPQCAHVNGPTNTFCGSCGFRLGGQAGRSMVPPAPSPLSADLAGKVVLTALRADGSEAGTFQLPSTNVTVGRDSGGIFAGDSYLSPRHATLRQPGPGRLLVKDEASLNGVYKKLARDVPVELRPNDVFRIGQEIIRFEPLAPKPPSADGVERLGAPSKGYVGRIALIIGRDATGNAFPVPEAGVHLGRERGDVLFPEDGYVSGLHCRLAWENGRGLLTDLGSSNGTFIRIKEETEVRSGDVLLMGQQLFRITM